VQINGGTEGKTQPIKIYAELKTSKTPVLNADVKVNAFLPGSRPNSEKFRLLDNGNGKVLWLSQNIFLI